MVSFKQDIANTSKEINLNGVGSYPLEVLNKAKKVVESYELGINLSNILVDRKNLIFSKILRISPRYIIVNRCKQDIQINQEGCLAFYQIVNPEGRIPFYWNDAAEK